MSAAVRLSTIRPYDDDVTQAREFCRNEFAKSVDFAELIEAFANNLDDNTEAEVMRRVQACRERINAGSPINIVDAMVITGYLLKAFNAHVNRYAENDLDSYLNAYADRKAEHLIERGVIVDFTA